jgi:DNA-binding NarL/FixJ family response regulator
MEVPQSPNNRASRQPIRIVVADAQPVVCTGLVYGLKRRRDIVVLGMANNGATALHLAQTTQPDVLVVDHNLPGPPVAEVIRQIRALPSPPQVMLLTTNDEPDVVLQMLQAGAIGYVMKDADLADIVAAIRDIARGERRLSPAVESRLLDHTVRKATEPAPDPPSGREEEVLRLLGAGKTNAEIGAALNIAPSTVSFHIGNIRDKLGLQSRGEIIAWAVRHGFGPD